MAEIAGLTLITPSSVAGSGVSLSGAKVVFTAATSISVNGVFDTYDNYIVVMRTDPSSGGAAMRIRLRSSGTDATGTNYTIQLLSANNTTVSGSRSTSADHFRINLTNDQAGFYDGTHVYFYGPNLAQPTAVRSVTVSGYSSALIYDYANTHSLSTAYDGFTLDTTSPNLTGMLCVYGLSQ